MVIEIPGGDITTPYNLNVYGETYVLTGDINAPGAVFVVTNDNITIDGAGNTINFATISNLDAEK